MLWFGKAVLQYGLSKVPFGEAVNAKLQLLGGKRSDDYFHQRTSWGLAFQERLQPHCEFEGKTVLEIGTGWDAIHTIILHLAGAQRIISVDVYPHLRLSLAHRVVGALRGQTARAALACRQSEAQIVQKLDRLEAATSLDELIECLQVDYRAPGDASRTGMPDSSVDMVYSYAVFAHVPVDVLEAIVAEEFRIVRSGGVSVHRVVMEDPFAAENNGDGVNFLRFSDTAWKLLGENNIRFHNRLRASEYLKMYRSATTNIVYTNSTLLPENLVNLRKIRVIEKFAEMTPEDLATTGLDLVVRHQG